MNNQNIAVILPVYNSEKHLKKLISEIAEFVPRNQIYAVDDGSTDNSRKVCQNEGVRIVSYNTNRGKGYALQTGLKKALDDNFQFAVCMDSDEQHAPQHIPQFIEEQNKSNAAIVLGYRSLTTKFMPFARICSNKITSFIVSVTVGKRIIDSQCGFRLYRLNDIKDMNFKTSRYQFETEILLKLAKKNAKISQIPVKTIYGDETSHIRHFRDIFNFVKLIISSWLNI